MELMKYMEEKNVTLLKRIFCKPKKEEGKKREPRSEIRADVEIKYYGSVKLFLKEMNSSDDPKEVYFSDYNCFLEFVDGLNEVVETNKLEVKIGIK